MSLYVCSLANNNVRSIPASKWVALPFPYTTPPTSYDPWEMHRPTQPGGTVSAYPDKYSALIHPAADGWGTLEGHIELEAGDYDEVRTRFVRDPYGSGDEADDRTNTEHHACSPGMQFFTVLHRMFLHPGVPVAFQIYIGGGSGPVDLVYSQFKLDVNDDVAVPGA
jgi:hypothetical protein